MAERESTERITLGLKRKLSSLREVNPNIIFFRSNSKGGPPSFTFCTVAGTHHLGLFLCDDPQSLAASSVHLLGDRKHLPETKKSQ